MPFTHINIGMLTGSGFEDLEFWAVYMRMKEERANITVIASEKGREYKSKSGGLSVVSDMSSEEALDENFDLLLVPGGWAPDKIRRDRNVIELVQNMFNDEKLLGFICHGGWVAASAGIVKGRMCTGSMGIYDDMINAGATWMDEPALQDGHLLWGRVVKDIPDYNRLVVSAVKEYSRTR